MDKEHPKLDYHKDVKQLEDILRTKLRFILKEFPCPHIALQNVELDDVVSIFERINTTGQKLNAFDLLIAKLSKYGIKLRELWEDACKKPKIKQYLEKSKNFSIMFRRASRALANFNLSFRESDFSGNISPQETILYREAMDYDLHSLRLSRP